MKKILVSLLLLFVLTVGAVGTDFSEEDTFSEAVSLPIVMYHHLSPKQKLWGPYVLPVDQFEQDLIYLRDNGYTTVTTADLLAFGSGEGTLPDKPVLITFDDGFESTFVYALPLLEKYGMTAVVFPIGSTTQQYTETANHVLDYSYMSWAQVAKLDVGSVIEVQCHTYDMHKLSPRKGCGPKKGESSDAYRAAFEADIEQFQMKLIEYTGHTSTALALPFGVYAKETIRLAANAGFQLVFTCSEKINRLTGDPDELLELGRYNRPYGESSEQFFSKWK